MTTDTSPAISTLRDVCAEPYGVWLDSSMANSALGARSFWAAGPVAVLRSWGRRVEVERGSVTERFEGDPFEALREMLAEHSRYREGAAVGYLGYGLKRHVERLPDTVTDDLGMPECHLAFYERLHEIDPGPLAPAETPELGREFPKMRSTFSRSEYEAAVRRALDYIRAGDIYQVNLSQRFEAVRRGGEDPFDVYLRLRALSPAPFAAFLRLPDCAVLSSSPERFLRYTPEDRLIETRPIKGTRPRGATPGEDEALRRELLASEKDRAENVMIVDLERNDLGRVAEIGSVRVTGLFEAGDVRDRAPPGVDGGGAPCGGARRRGPAAGDVPRRVDHGRAEDTGDGDHRRAGAGGAGRVHRRHRIHQAGWGDGPEHRDPQHDSEGRPGVLLGGRRHRRGLGPGCRVPGDAGQGRGDGAGARGRGRMNVVWVNGRFAAADEPAVRADDAGLLFGRGVYDTFRARGGRVFRLEAHVARITAGASVVGIAMPSLDAEAVVRELCERCGVEDARVRMTLTAGPAGGAPTLIVQARAATDYAPELYERGMAALISPVRRNETSPLAGVKSLNCLDNIMSREWAHSQGADTALLLNTKGMLAEASTANVFVVRDGGLVTPPISDGALPGVTRSAVLELARDAGIRGGGDGRSRGRSCSRRRRRS